jgi:endogenous inhibitor of DNA gyrase (YacG/DUF329 family)
MSERMVRECDECGALHGTVNNWWCAVGSASHPTFVPFEHAEEMARQRAREAEFRLDLCSHKCAGTAFNRWLDTGSVAKP